MHGFVLTSAKSQDSLYHFLRLQNTQVLKLIPAWFPFDPCLFLATTPDTIIRTSYGDPSRDKQRAFDTTYSYLLPETLQELESFLRIKPHAYIELGNEPNLDDVDFWVYRWFLLESIKLLRKKYPYAKLISPAPSVDSTHREKAIQFYATCQDALLLCDYAGIHAYEDESFARPTTNQLQTAIGLSTRFLGNKPLILTEYGINSKKISQNQKLVEYRSLQVKYQQQIKFFCAFHIDDLGDEFSNYTLRTEQ